jgi:hypothetical protein
MKTKLVLLLTILIISRCNNLEQNQSKMKGKATIVEMVLFKTNKGIKRENAEKAITELNEFVSKQKGFVSRKTSISEDGQFLDIIYWTDLRSAKTAAENAMNNPKTSETFKIMNEKNMIFEYFSIFNEIKESNTQNLATEEKIILETAKNYPRAFKNSDPKLIDECFSPQAIKMGYFYDYEKDEWMDNAISDFEEIKKWASEYNTNNIMPKSNIKATLLDFKDKIAVVKIELEWAPEKWGCDYVFLIKENNKWSIIKILWQSIV